MEIKRGQSIIDVAMIATGTAEAAIEVAIANGVALTADPAAETPQRETWQQNSQARWRGARWQGTGAVNRQVKNMLELAKAEPATGVSEADEEAAPYRGVGFWTIGNDFEIG